MTKAKRLSLCHALLHQADATLRAAMQLAEDAPLTSHEIRNAQFNISDAIAQSEREAGKQTKAIREPKGSFVVNVEDMDGDVYKDFYEALSAIRHAFAHKASKVTIKPFMT